MGKKAKYNGVLKITKRYLRKRRRVKKKETNKESKIRNEREPKRSIY